MATLKSADRVKETSTTNGTGSYTLAGAAAGFQSFLNGIGNGAQCFYCAEDGTHWEVGLGTLSGGNTLSRDEILASDSGAAVNWAGGTTKNMTVVHPANRVTVPQVHWIQGLRMLYLTTSTFKVLAGSCSDKDFKSGLVLPSDVTVDLTTAGQNGLDQFTSGNTANASGSSSVTASGSVLAELLPKTHPSITFSTSGATLTASDDVRGWLSVGDQGGTSTAKGFSRVVSISADGKTIGLQAALPGGNASAGTALEKLEQPTVKFGTNAAMQVNTIDSAGTTIVVNGTPTGGAGLAIKWGVLLNSAFYAVWATKESATTGIRASTQRTTPYANTTLKRRIGWVRLTTGANLNPFADCGGGRIYDMCGSTANNTRVMNNGSGSAAAWQTFDCSGCLPPTATTLLTKVQITSTLCAFAQTPAQTNPVTELTNLYAYINSGTIANIVEIPLSLAQQFDAVNQGSTNATIVDSCGWLDDLSR